MRNILTEIGNTMRQRRELLGLLQPRLAEIAKVSTRTIQLVEQGKGNPSIRTLTRLADPLGLTVKLELKNLSKKEN